MREQRIRIQELETNLSTCLEEVRGGTTLLLTDSGHRVARLIPEPGASESENSQAIRLERAATEEDQAQGASAGRRQHGRHRQGEPWVRLLYVDTSALFKRYVEEDESEAVLARMEQAPAVGTVLITRVEVAAALAKAVRQRLMDRNEALAAEREFLDEWDDLTRIGVTDSLAARADNLAWAHGLRGYDAAQTGGSDGVARDDRRRGRRYRIRVLRQRPAPGGNGGRSRDVAGMSSPVVSTLNQARSTANTARLRVSLLNSTAIRWIGCSSPRYLSA